MKKDREREGEREKQVDSVDQNGFSRLENFFLGACETVRNMKAKKQVELNPIRNVRLNPFHPDCKTIFLSIFFKFAGIFSILKSKA